MARGELASDDLVCNMVRERLLLPDADAATSSTIGFRGLPPRRVGSMRCSSCTSSLTIPPPDPGVADVIGWRSDYLINCCSVLLDDARVPPVGGSITCTSSRPVKMKFAMRLTGRSWRSAMTTGGVIQPRLTAYQE